MDATLEAQRSASSTSSSPFDERLQNIALSLFKEPLQDYRRWVFLTLFFVAISLALLVVGVTYAYAHSRPVAYLSACTSLLSSTISVLLYKQLRSAQATMEGARREVLKQLKERASKPSVQHLAA